MNSTIQLNILIIQQIVVTSTCLKQWDWKNTKENVKENITSIPLLKKWYMWLYRHNKVMCLHWYSDLSSKKCSLKPSLQYDPRSPGSPVQVTDLPAGNFAKRVGALELRASIFLNKYKLPIMLHQDRSSESPVLELRLRLTCELLGHKDVVRCEK